jgi:chromosome segregation ATPase
MGSKPAEFEKFVEAIEILADTTRLKTAISEFRQATAAELKQLERDRAELADLEHREAAVLSTAKEQAERAEAKEQAERAEEQDGFERDLVAAQRQLTAERAELDELRENLATERATLDERSQQLNTQEKRIQAAKRHVRGMLTARPRHA